MNRAAIIVALSERITTKIFESRKDIQAIVLIGSHGGLCS